MLEVYNQIKKSGLYSNVFFIPLLLLSFSIKCFCQTPSNNCSATFAQQLSVNSSPCNNFTLFQWDISTNVGAPVLTPGCNGIAGAGRDGWGWFTATTTISNVEYVNKNGDAQIYIYSGTCGALTLIACADDWVVNNPEIVTFTTTIGSNYFIRIVSVSGGVTMLGSTCVWGTIIPPPCTPLPANDDPCTAINLTVGVSCSYTTYTNACATPTNSVPPPGCGNYTGGDVWFKATVPASGQITFDSNTGVVLDGGMALYAASSCSTGLTLLTCDDDNSANGLMPKISASGLNPGDVVYLRMWENGNDNNGTFKICCYDSSPCGSTPANDDPCGALLLTAGVACTFTTYTNLCSSASTAAGIPLPSCSNYNGGDVWFKVVIPASGTLSVRTNTGVMTDGGLAIYTATACNGTFTEIDCDDDSGPGLMPLIFTSGLTAGSTVYIRVWSFNNAKNGTFRLCVTDPCPGGTPVNDLPCNATTLPYNIYYPGTNGCATNVNDPVLPACFINNGGALQLNTVWYKFTATSTCTKIKTFPGTLVNTQMAVYAGTCGALGVAIACNDDYQPCAGGFTYRYSQLTLNTVVGAVYYIMIDGKNGSTGSFSIEMIDGGAWSTCSNNFPPLTGQDCALPLPVCSYSLGVANPGFLTIGNVCDFSAPASCPSGIFGCSTCGSTCLCTGERGSSWYKITIGNVVGTQYLEFTIVPNNHPGLYVGEEADYDFAVFGPNPNCSNLTTPLRCNYNALGVTGVYGTVAGQAPLAYTGFEAAFRERIPVNTGEVYYLNISNFENNKFGYTLNISPATPLANVIPPGGTIIWTGAISTDWFDPNNWGGCQIPNCSVNAMIPAFSANQPVINGIGANCRNLDINFGSVLTVNSGFDLNVCGDFLNNGTFTANTSSTVIFQDTSASLSTFHNQLIDGSVTGANKFWNVTVKKPIGWKVISNQDVDMAGNFLISGAAGSGGEFSAAGKYHRIGGNFTVEASPLVATYTSGTTLEFNGTAQTYLNRGMLNNVLMNQSASGSVTLQNHLLAGTAWMQLSSASILTLTNGKIIAGVGTAAANDNRVELLNSGTGAITTGNASSYIEGTLRRKMNSASGGYDFPVGTAAKGYQRINFNFTTALPAGVVYWNVYFNNTAPATNTGLSSECSSNYHPAGLFALDNGYWSVETSPASIGTGIMNVTNYNGNLSWTVGLGAGWTVMYNNTTNNGAGNWLLNPFPAFPCVSSLVTSVLRNNMQISSLFTGNPVWFGTAQSQSPLPVELLNLEAHPLLKSINLKWTTASESNNRGFELERALLEPGNFKKIGWLQGKGTTTSAHDYDFEDINVQPGITYFYRLKQMDLNGNVNYSKTVAAKLTGSAFNFSVSPNPYTKSTNIIIDLKEFSSISLSIYNSWGQKVATLFEGKKPEGSYTFRFSAEEKGYTSGMYAVKFQINDLIFSKTIIETGK